MSPIFEALLAAAAAQPVVASVGGGIGGGGLVVLLWKGLRNCVKVPEDTSEFCDGVVKLQDSKDRMVGNRNRRIRCDQPDCGEMVRRNEMAEHLQQHIDILNRNKILSDLRAVKEILPVGNEGVHTEAVNSGGDGHIMENLLAKEADAIAKKQSEVLENKERYRKAQHHPSLTFRTC